jgi:hypothetical protein
MVSNAHQMPAGFNGGTHDRASDFASIPSGYPNDRGADSKGEADPNPRPYLLQQPYCLPKIVHRPSANCDSTVTIGQIVAGQWSFGRGPRSEVGCPFAVRRCAAGRVTRAC